jgi:hypothetical protein
MEIAPFFFEHVKALFGQKAGFLNLKLGHTRSNHWNVSLFIDARVNLQSFWTHWWAGIAQSV